MLQLPSVCWPTLPKRILAAAPLQRCSSAASGPLMVLVLSEGWAALPASVESAWA